MSPYELGLIALFGVLQNAAGLIFYAYGSRRVPAAEATLIAALEVPLTPFWVLVFMNEVPGVPTLIGGGVVLVALFCTYPGGIPQNQPEPGAALPGCALTPLSVIPAKAVNRAKRQWDSGFRRE